MFYAIVYKYGKKIKMFKKKGKTFQLFIIYTLNFILFLS